MKSVFLTDTTKVHPLPKHITEQYDGGSREFKASKRDLLRRVRREWDDFRIGCAYMPGGAKRVTQVDALLKEIAAAISEKTWGR